MREAIGTEQTLFTKPYAGLRRQRISNALGSSRISNCPACIAPQMRLCILRCTKVSECRNGSVSTFYVHPSDFGLPKAVSRDLLGGDAATNAGIIRDILGGAKGARRDVVLLNAGASLFVGGKAASVREGIQRAAEAIDSGSAARTLNAMVAASKGQAAGVKTS